MVKLQDVLDARERIASIAHVTPLDRAHAFGNLVGCELYLKAENLQRTGSFKIRGAANKLAVLSQPEKARGVIAASTGTHAQGGSSRRARIKGGGHRGNAGRSSFRQG